MAVNVIRIPESVDLFSEGETSRLLGKSVRTLRRMHTERRGPKRTRVGRTPYYRRVSLENFLAAGEIEQAG